MRCPNCNKFVSYDEPEAEIEYGEVEENDGENSFFVSATVRVVLKCAECGDELKETNGDITLVFNHSCGEKLTAENFEIESIEAEGCSRVQDKDKHGRQIKNHRYMKTFYGCEVTGTFICSLCDESISESETFEEQASSFDELV